MVKKMKLLFFGAGVLGSLYAARLHEAGHDVTLLARGSRYRDLKERGVVLEAFDSGETTRTFVPVVDTMPTEEPFDACIILVRGDQLDEALEVLKQNPHIDCYVSMVNAVTGTRALVDALGRDRVVLGHANAGGEREGHLVRYMISQEITLGELHGERTERLEALADAFRSADLPVVFSRDMDSWKRHHVALAVPFANALYMTGGCNYRLSHHREALRLCLDGIREGFRALRTMDFPVEPPKLRWVFALPNAILIPLFARILRLPVADIGMARHARNARDEMAELGAELDALIATTGATTPALDALRPYADPSLPLAVEEDGDSL